MTPTIRPAGNEDLTLLASQMRDIDRLEVEAMTGRDAASALMQFAPSSRRMTAGYADDRLVAVWGVSAPTLLSADATPWLLATDAIGDRDVRRTFLRLSRQEMERLVDGYRRLWNWVHADNAIAIRWLKWLGFQFPGAKSTVRGEPFLYFQKEVF